MEQEQVWHSKDGRIIVKKIRKCPVCGKIFNKASSAKMPTCSMKCKYSSSHWIESHSREKNQQWRGGRIVDYLGYVRVHFRSHKKADINGYVKEHVLVAENKIGRPIRQDEVVHHINEIKTDNRPENLEVLTRGAHFSHHKREYWAKKRGNISNG